MLDAKHRGGIECLKFVAKKTHTQCCCQSDTYKHIIGEVFFAKEEKIVLKEKKG